jgi:hypothetical protein
MGQNATSICRPGGAVQRGGGEHPLDLAGRLHFASEEGSFLRHSTLIAEEQPQQSYQHTGSHKSPCVQHFNPPQSKEIRQPQQWITRELHNKPDQVGHTPQQAQGSQRATSNPGVWPKRHEWCCRNR